MLFPDYRLNCESSRKLNEIQRYFYTKEFSILSAIKPSNFVKIYMKIFFSRSDMFFLETYFYVNNDFNFLISDYINQKVGFIETKTTKDRISPKRYLYSLHQNFT